MKDIQMTLAEQLVWAVAFVAAYDKDAEGRMTGRRDDRLLMYAQKAAEVVSDMHRADLVVETEESWPPKRIDVTAASMLRSMTARPVSGIRKA